MRAKTDFGLDTLVRMLYLEPIVQDRKVLLAGRGAEATAKVLRRMGASRVETMEQGSARPLPWDLAGLRGKRDSRQERSAPARPGEFDLVLVPELSELDDYRAVLGEISRSLGREGMAVVATRNAECMVPISSSGLDSSPEIWNVESLQDLLGQYFDEVELVGQSPFLGYALASWHPERGRQGVRLDTSLMNEQGEDPEFLVAICGRAGGALPLTNALFQMPMAEMTLVEGSAPERREQDSDREAELRAEVESLRRELGNRNVVTARLEKEIERLEAEAEAGRQKLFDLRQRLERERKDHQSGTLDTAIRRETGKIPETWLTERATLVREGEELARAKIRAEKELHDLQARLDREIEAVRAASAAASLAPDPEQQARAARLEERATDLQARAERAEARAKDLLTGLKQTEARLREEETRGPELGKRAAELESALVKIERELESVKAQRDRLETEASVAREQAQALAARAGMLEARLQDIEAAPQPAPVQVQVQGAAGDGESERLGAEIARRDEIIRDLIRDLETLPCLSAQEGQDRDRQIHELVGTMEKLRGEKAELTRLVAGMAAELDLAHEKLMAAEQEAVEASAIVEIVGSALENAGGETVASASPSATGMERIDRTLVDLQEMIRTLAADTRAESVARDLGQIWVRIEEKRRGL